MFWLMARFIERAGQRFGRLTVSHWFHRKIGARQRIYWHCLCDCGGTVAVEASNLVNGHALSCGCLQKESRHTNTKTHGGTGTRTYNIWKGMWKRCINQDSKSYADYGGRGIAVCPRWKDFEAFLSDMGAAPPTCSIDRINNSLGYTPENCRWVDHRAQANNCRRNIFLTLNGETLTVSQWATKSGVPYHTLWQRLYRLKWPLSRSLIP